MPAAVHQEFLALLPTKTQSTSVAGKVYCAQCAKEMDLVDTDRGIARNVQVPTPQS
jgi:hypothetical protein